MQVRTCSNAIRVSSCTTYTVEPSDFESMDMMTDIGEGFTVRPVFMTSEDDIIESDEFFTVMIMESPSEYTLGSISVATVRIIDEDGNLPVVLIITLSHCYNLQFLLWKSIFLVMMLYQDLKQTQKVILRLKLKCTKENL